MEVVHVMAPPPTSASPLLFCLQVFVDRVEFDATALCDLPKEPTTEFLAAFQLLQFEVVCMDTIHHSLSSAAVNSGEADGSTCWRLHEGKSCLFETSPTLLEAQLTTDPVTLMLLKKSPRFAVSKAQLCGFTCVDLQVRDRRQRTSCSGICEWASCNDKWPLVNHANNCVGFVIGSITLSCLGNALAPHLTRAVGVQVDHLPSNVTERASFVDTKQLSLQTPAQVQDPLPTQCSVDALQSSEPVQAFKGAKTTHQSIQCSLLDPRGLFYQRDAPLSTPHRSKNSSRSPSPAFPRATGSSSHRGITISKDPAKTLREKNANPKEWEEEQQEEQESDCRGWSTRVGLPPPLFYHKPLASELPRATQDKRLPKDSRRTKFHHVH